MQLEEAALHEPELSLLATELERGLKGNFSDAWGAPHSHAARGTYACTPRRLRASPCTINQIIGQLRASRSLILPAVKVAACPDLTQAPYGLAASGLGGRPVLVDVGGVMNLQYVANRQNAHFDIGGSPRIIASHF